MVAFDLMFQVSVKPAMGTGRIFEVQLRVVGLGGISSEKVRKETLTL